MSVNSRLSKFAGKHVLIIGGTGFIGFNLIQRLRALGSDVDTIYIRKNITVNARKRYIINIGHYSSVVNVIKNRYDYVYYCAGRSNRVARLQSFRAGARTNILGVVNVIDSIFTYSRSTKLILLGSRQEYGKSEYLPVDENHPTSPQDPYAIEKLASTLYAQASGALYNIDAVVVRLSNTYGALQPFQKENHNVLNQCIRRAIDKKLLTIFGDGNQKRDYLYINDLVDALLLVGIERKTNGHIYNIGYGKGITFKEMIDKISSQTGAPVTRVEWPKDYLSIETGDYVTDITRLSNVISWTPRVTYDQGILKTIEQYAQKNGNR